MEDSQERIGVQNGLLRVVDALPGLVWTALPDGYVDFLNQRWCEYTGLGVEEAYGQGWQTAIHPEDLPELLERWQSILASGEPREMEARLRRFDGEYRWFLFRTCPLADASGRVVKWCGMNTAIDDRRRAEALLAGEKRLLEMIATGKSLSTTLTELCLLVEELCPGCVSCSILLLDLETKKLWLGASPSVPKAYTESIDGFAIGPDASSCGAAAYHGKQIITSDIATDPRWAESRDLALANGLRACWSTPIFSQQNRVLGTFAMFSGKPGNPTTNDQEVIAQITHLASIAIERSRVEENLRRSKAYLSEAQKLSLTGSFGWNVSADEHFWSDETFRIFEYDVSTKVTLQLILERAHPQDIPLIRQAIALAADGRDFDYECRFIMPGGAVKHLHLVAHGTRDQDGRLECIGAVQDVTERRLSEETLGKVRSELAHVARITSLGALTASIAHEVNQPLSGIITNASTCLRMLAADPPNVSGALKTARRTIRDGNRAAEVITRLRALFARTGATTETVDLNEATREVIALSWSEFQRSRVILRSELANDLPPVTGDRVQLQQVILNLLLNASDAMSGVDDRPRQLVIRTERDKCDHVRLTVQDAGIGVEPQGVDKLFEAFYTTKSSGMGIGLSVSRSIIESHHGRLWAAPNDGPGATFSFSIPRGPEGVTGANSFGAIRKPAVTDAVRVMRNP
jgi:PAS domain S-box-containing protein